METVPFSKVNDTRLWFRYFAVVLAGFVAVYTGWFIVSGENPMTAAIVAGALVMFVTALVNPKGGVYLLILTTGYLDLFKRLGILSGLDPMHVIVTLAVAPVLFCCICIGIVLRGIFLRRPIERWQWILLLVSLFMIGAAFFHAFSRGGSRLGALQEFANSGVYWAMIFVTSLLFTEVEEIQKVIGFCLLVYVPVALYGVWQQIFGLSDFEIQYLKSGYTMTIGLLDDVKPRPFSTLNSPHALGVLTASFAAVAALVPLRASRRRSWQLPLAFIFAAGCFAALTRVAWVLLILAVIGWICFRSAKTTLAFYGTIVALFLLLMLNADTLLKNLDRYEEYLPMKGDFNEQVFRLQTMSDRLYSFHDLIYNPRYHTLFGNPNLLIGEVDANGDRLFAHDQVTEIVVSHGFVGLFIAAVLTIGGLWYAHRRVLEQTDPRIRRMALGLLSLLMAVIYSGMIFGSALSVFPVDFFFPFFVGLLAILCGKQWGPAGSQISARSERINPLNQPFRKTAV